MCEKCVRTMVGLTVWDALPRFTVFPESEVTPDMIERITLRDAYTYLTMPDLLAGLERVGRTDLVRVIRTKAGHLSAPTWRRLPRKWKRSFAKRIPRFRAPRAPGSNS